MYFFSYNVCIRPEPGFCCIQYMLCQNEPNPFSLDTQGAADMKAKQESDCTLDYITISGSSVSCVQGSQNGNALTNKYCGTKLNPVKEAMADVAICGTCFHERNGKGNVLKNCSILDCTAPFSVQIVTDAFTDMGDAATANDFDNSRGLIFLCISCVAYKLCCFTGVCLEWTQIPCQG